MSPRSIRLLHHSMGALALAAAGVASATPVSFNVTPAGFTPGSGYGVDANEPTGTLLDVTFTANPVAQAFALANVGDSFTFTFGTIVLAENSAIRVDETDGLGVTAEFSFVDPTGGLASVTATGTAVVGALLDFAVDYTISWTDTDVAFGNGGLFRISMPSNDFRSSGASRTQTATITLLALPVPEPASLALAGLALAGAGFARRRRA